MKLASFFYKLPKGMKALLLIIILMAITLGILWLIARGQSADLVTGYFNLSDAQATQNSKLQNNNVKDVFTYDSTGESWKAGGSWIKNVPNPVLSPDGTAGEDSVVWQPSVIKDGNTYKMWYAAISTTGIHSIRYVESTDGKNWITNRQAVMGLSLGSYTQNGVSAPYVIKDLTEPDPNKRYKMWYEGYTVAGNVTNILYATSSESDGGINWTGPVLALDYSPLGEWDQSLVGAPSVIKVNPTSYKMWYTTGRRDPYTGMHLGVYIGHATSYNGMDWTKTTNRFSDATIGTLRSPSVIVKDGIYEMWYTREQTKLEIAHAISSDNGVNWTVEGTALTASSSDIDWDFAHVYHADVYYDSTSKKLSMWYTGASATAGQIGLATKSGSSSFPNKANLVLTSAGLDIINADTNELYMNFVAGTNNMLGIVVVGWAPNALTSVTAQNGKIYVGIAGDSNGGLTILDFTQDKGYFVRTDGSREYKGNLSTRNNALGYNPAVLPPTGYRLIADNIDGNKVKDVSAATVNGVGYVAVLTDGAIYPAIGPVNNGSKITILKEGDPGYSRDIEFTCPFGTCFFDFAYVFNKIYLASDGTLYIARKDYFRHASSGSIAPRTTTAPALLADYNALSGTGKRNLYAGNQSGFDDVVSPGAYAYKSPQIIASTQFQSIRDIYATIGTSPTGNNTIYVATNAGATQIKENKTTPASGISTHWANTSAVVGVNKILKENDIAAISSANTDGVGGDDIMWAGQENMGVAEINLITPGSVFYNYDVSTDIGVSSNSITSLSYGDSLLVGTSKMGSNRLANYTPGSDVIIPEGNWIKNPLNPVLSPIAGTSEALGVWQPSVIKDGNTYKMWYAGISSGGIHSISYVESTDGGVTWTTNRQLTTGLSAGSLTTNGVANPSVIKDPTELDPNKRYKMWYIGYNSSNGNDAILYATSSNGIAWSAGTSVLPKGVIPQWDSGRIGDPYVIKVSADDYRMWYTGIVGPPTTSSIGYATSLDGTVWIKHAFNPVLSEVASWVSTYREPSVIYNASAPANEQFKMWFSRYGTASPSNTEIAYTTSPDGKTNWTVPATVFAGTTSFEVFGVQHADVYYDSTSKKLSMWYTASTATIAQILLATKQLGKIDISGSDQDNDGISDRKDICPLLYQNNNCYISRAQRIITTPVPGPEITTLDGNVTINFDFIPSSPISVTGGESNFRFSSNMSPMTGISNYRFEPACIIGSEPTCNFSLPVTITMKYPDIGPAGGDGIVDGTTIREDNVKFGVYYNSPKSGWALLPETGGNCSTPTLPKAKDCIANTITFTTNHFSEFAIAGSLEGPVISSIDNNEPESSGGITPLISETPTFSGMANPNDTVSVYTQTAGTTPSIAKIVGESDLSLTYQPAGLADPGPGFFTENFDSALNPNIWRTGTQNGGNIYGSFGTLVTYTTGLDSAASVFSSPDYRFNLFNATKPLFTEIELTINEATGSGYRISFGIDNGSTINIKAVDIEVNNNGIAYNINDGTVPGGIHGSLTLNIPAIGQKVKLRIEINNFQQIRFMADTNMDGVFESISPWESFTLWSELTEINFGVQNQQNTGNIMASWDNLVTNFPLPPIPIPEGYNMARTGMSLNGATYMDAFSLGGPLAPGVVWTGGGTPVFLPGFIPSANLKINYNDFSQYPDPQDIYVYLATVNFGGPPVHATFYDTKTPGIFAQFVVAGTGGAITVDAFAKALTYSGNNTYTSLFPPFLSQGRIVYNSTTMQAEIVSGGAVVETLLARAITDTNGYWTAFFGIDELGNGITELIGKTLLDLSLPPYTFIARTPTGQSLPVVASVALPPVDVTPPTTTAAVTGILEDYPYNTWYKNQATVTLEAIDNGGSNPSGVAKIEYSLSGATIQALTTYTAPIIITSGGETIVTFKASDNAGNVEQNKTVAVNVDKDTDGDGVYNNIDICDSTVGTAINDGCAYAVNINEVLHILYTGAQPTLERYAGKINNSPKNSAMVPLKVGAIGDSRNEEVTSIKAKLYKLSDLGATFDTIKSQCSTIFDSNVYNPINAKDIVTGTEMMGVSGVGDYVAMEKVNVYDPLDNTTRWVTACRPILTTDFIGNTASKKMIVSKVVKSVGIQLNSTDEVTLRGSTLEIFYPAEALWEAGVSEYIYPYIFTSDSNWNVDVCTYAPVGYKVAGVYNEDGQLIGSSECSQTLVANQTKVVAFGVVKVGSPKEFDVNLKITGKPKGEKAQKADVQMHTKVVSGDKISKDGKEGSPQGLFEEVEEAMDKAKQNRSGDNNAAANPRKKARTSAIKRAIDFIQDLF